jgi:hypothetical protein
VPHACHPACSLHCNCKQMVKRVSSIPRHPGWSSSPSTRSRPVHSTGPHGALVSLIAGGGGACPAASHRWERIIHLGRTGSVCRNDASRHGPQTQRGADEYGSGLGVPSSPPHDTGMMDMWRLPDHFSASAGRAFSLPLPHMDKEMNAPAPPHVVLLVVRTMVCVRFFSYYYT